MSPLAISLLVAALAAGALVIAVAIGRMREAEPDRPWWSHQVAWVGVSVVITLLGAILIPRILGFAFLFLPLILFRGARRRPPNRPHPADEDRWGSGE